ncbi:MAG TPA: amidase family protein [Thermodesulfobacteriota bacterium]|nr:amidase family protein [Thermodesulfobacteriota bacterium]
MTEFWKLSGLELREMIAAKEVKPSEIMATVLARIEKLNPKLNAFCTITQDSAMAEARQADEEMTKKKDTRPLFGLPVSIKDLIFTKGIRTTFASKMHENFIPDQDEVVVERLKAAGAIIIGKTNSCEYGYKAVTDNPLWGITRNPWNLEMTPAGSSGGAGAAVASGMGPLALGSDGGGSVRAPASFCGIFGLKSSRGRIPMYPLLSGWETLDRRVAHYGPLTRTVADAAIMMEVMAGPDERDPSSLPGARVDYRKETKKGIRGLRIAWSRDLGHVVVDPVVGEALEGAARVFSKMGCKLEEAAPEFPLMHDAFRLLFAADCAGALGAHLDEWKGRLDPGLVTLTEIGLKTGAVDYVRAVNRCHILWERLQPFFAKYDLLLTPTLPLPPFPVGTDWPREVAGQKVHPLNYLGFTYPFNLTGQPAASLPCAWAADGLPIGLQVVGRRFEDGTVLRAAAAFEAARPWKDKWPD